MYTIYEYDTDPTTTTTRTSPVVVIDDDVNETSSSSLVASSSSTLTTRDSKKQILPKKEFHIRWANNNNNNNNNHDVDATSAVVTTTVVECVPVVHSSMNKSKGFDQSNTTRTTTTSTGSSTKNNNKNNIFMILYHSILSLLHTIQNILYELLLPYQYPNSVRNGYIQYQIYDSLQGLCSYLRNIVCSAALFQAVMIMNQNHNNNSNNNSEDGIGNDDTTTTSSNSNNSVSSTAWNAAIVWAIRDGTGLIGSLLYTYMISTYLDAYVKEFRFFADIINDIGFTFDMILPYIDDTSQNNNNNNSHSTMFWIVSSMSVLCKMMCGVSAGATKSSITCHFAIQGNMADLNAKESTQETMVTLIGMIGGIYVAKLLQSLENDSNGGINSRNVTWMFFLLLTLIHIYANYLGVSLLRLRTINTSRIDPCLQNMYKSILVPDIRSTILKMNCSTTNKEKTQQQQQQQHDDLRALLSSTIASPTQIREIMFLPVWQFFGILPSSCIYCNTIPYHQLQSYFHQSLLGQIIVESKNKDSIWFNSTTIISSLRYNVTIMMNNDTVKRRRIPSTKVAITLFTGATSNDEFQAYLHAKLIVILLLQLQTEEEQFLNNHISLPYKNTTPSSSQIRQVFIDSYELIQLLFQQPRSGHETNESGTQHEQPFHVPLIIDILQEKDWDVSRFYFNYPPRRCQLVLNTTTETPIDDDLSKLLTNKKDD